MYHGQLGCSSHPPSARLIASLGSDEAFQIMQSKHLDKFLVFLGREELGQTVSSHACCRGPSNVYSSLLDLLSEPMVIDVNVPELGVILSVFSR